MDGIVDAHAEDNACHQHRERVQGAVVERGEAHGERTGKQYLRKHQEGRLDGTAEEHRDNQEDEDDRDDHRDGAVAHDVVHLVQALVGTFNSHEHRLAVVHRVELREKRIGTKQDVLDKVHVGRRADKLALHDAVEQRGIVLVLANQAGLELLGQVTLGAQVLLFHFRPGGVAALEEGFERIGGLVWQAERLRQVRVEPHTFLLRGFRTARRIGQEVHDERAVLATDFKLDILEVVADAFQVFYRQVDKGVLREERIVVFYLRPADNVVLPVRIDVFLDAVLQARDQVRVLRLDGNHEAVRTAESMVRFLERDHARRTFGQQRREVRMDLELQYRRDEAQDKYREDDQEGLPLVSFYKINVSRRKALNLFLIHLYPFLKTMQPFNAAARRRPEPRGSRRCSMPSASRPVRRK